MFRRMTIAAMFVALPLTVFAAPMSSGYGDTGKKLQKPVDPEPVSAVATFDTADKNHDGKIDWQEAQAQNVSKAIFEKNDFKNNGALDRPEWTLARYDVSDARSAAESKGK